MIQLLEDMLVPNVYQEHYSECQVGEDQENHESGRWNGVTKTEWVEELWKLERHGKYLVVRKLGSGGFLLLATLLTGSFLVEQCVVGRCGYSLFATVMDGLNWTSPITVSGSKISFFSQSIFLINTMLYAEKS